MVNCLSFFILILSTKLLSKPCVGHLLSSAIDHTNDSISTLCISLSDEEANFFTGNYIYIFNPVVDSSSGNDESAGIWKAQRVPHMDDLDTVFLKNSVASRFLHDESTGTDNKEEYSDYFSLLVNNFLSLSCVIFAALAAGLTMGLLSLDPLTLEIKRRASLSPEERQWSEDLLPLLVGHSKRHRLLVSLLLMNSIANESLPLFLDELLPGKYASILVSVTLVLFFGEIVPSAFFTGPDQVKIAAKMVPLVNVLMVIMYPLAAPIAKLLDKVLHEDGADWKTTAGAPSDTNELELDEEDVTGGNYYNRGELSALVRIQYEAQLAAKRRSKLINQSLLLSNAGKLVKANGAVPDPSTDISNSFVGSSTSGGGSKSSSRQSTDLTQNRKIPLKSSTQPMHVDEITIIEGALTMTTKVAADICTPMRRVYALPNDTILDEDVMVKIWSRGFSRIPVYAPKTDECADKMSLEVDTSGITGVLLSRQLIVLNPEEKRPITTVPLVSPPCIAPSVHLVDLINLFQAGGGRGKGGLHLAIVCARPNVASAALVRGECVPEEAGVIGIVTLEDVMEELLQEEIYDEADRDLELIQRGITKWKQFVKRKQLREKGHFDNTLVRKVAASSDVCSEKTSLLA